MLAVVIPVFNEASHLPALLDDLERLETPKEIIVVDGGSSDATVEVAGERGAHVLSAPRGRSLQMNAGARTTDATWLCFLHADVRMGERARRALERVVGDPDVEVAVWSLTIAADGLWPRVMEFGAYLRDRLGGLPYGDQGLLVRRALFTAVGGFPEIPIMEDVAIVRSLRSRTPIHRLPAALSVSPRRWEREGPYRAWVRNAVLVTAFLIGVAPERLARWYRPEPT